MNTKSIYERHGIYPIESTLEFIRNSIEASCVTGENGKRLPIKKKDGFIFDGVPVNVLSERYYCFLNSGTDCKGCGMKGLYFALERNKISNAGTDKFHFNLYGHDNKGNETMMTKDHIVPKSRGGKNNVANLQTMCSQCNQKKGAV